MENIYVMTMWVIPSDESKLARWSECTYYFSSLARAKDYILNWYRDDANLNPILEALGASEVIGCLGDEKSDTLFQYWIAAYNGITRKGNIRIDIYKDEVDPTYGDS